MPQIVVYFYIQYLYFNNAFRILNSLFTYFNILGEIADLNARLYSSKMKEECDENSFNASRAFL